MCLYAFVFNELYSYNKDNCKTRADACVIVIVFMLMITTPGGTAIIALWKGLDQRSTFFKHYAKIILQSDPVTFMEALLPFLFFQNL